MPLQQVSVGVATSLLQNVIYALPTRACYLVADPNCELSQSQAGPWIAMTGPTTGALTSASFIRCTTGVATVTCKGL